MHTQVTARHFHASPALRDYASERVAKLEKFYDGITDVRVVLSKASSENAAEITLNVFHRQLIAQHDGASFEEAIDQCVERLKKQILKYKAKLRSKNKHIHH